ncbi:cell division protein FtsL [Gracilibacillus dipsosauri]|uniref:Cell division protein FtsL n=1 Tax=Gracilibacillus dipsosauri TaxID=178340 RepID=A0A317L553_9BACI|nr:cell division protein FtsL [Gracilibacillus dipsosauri]PWU68959.1 cell division protein FtsL [Gracilibacillus dipsosauri]
MSTQHARNFQNHETWKEHQQTKQPNIVRKRVAVQKRWITRGEKFLYSLFAFGLLLGLAYMVYFSSHIDQLNRNIQTMNTEISQQTSLNQNLSYEVKELSQPDRIIANAKKHGLEIQNAKVKQASEVAE